MDAYQTNLIEDGLRAGEDVLDWMSGKRVHPVTRPEVERRINRARAVLRQVHSEGEEPAAETVVAGGA